MEKLSVYSKPKGKLDCLKFYIFFAILCFYFRQVHWYAGHIRVEYQLEPEFDYWVIPKEKNATIQLKGMIYAPKGNRKLPLIVLAHGNHQPCEANGKPLKPEQCTNDTEVRSDQGYEYMASYFVQQDYIVWAPNFNHHINLQLEGSDDIHARGSLMVRTLEAFSHRLKSIQGYEIGSRIDMSKIYLMGHSRGGEGVRKLYQLLKDSSLQSNVISIFEFAPTDFTRIEAIGVPWTVMVGTCDGDVANLEGVRVFQRHQSQNGTIDGLKTVLTLPGANHNFFNTNWDSSDSYRPHCSNPLFEMNATSSAIQQTVALQYMRENVHAFSHNALPDYQTIRTPNSIPVLLDSYQSNTHVIQYDSTSGTPKFSHNNVSVTKFYESMVELERLDIYHDRGRNFINYSIGIAKEFGLNITISKEFFFVDSPDLANRTVFARKDYDVIESVGAESFIDYEIVLTPQEHSLAIELAYRRFCMDLACDRVPFDLGFRFVFKNGTISEQFRVPNEINVGDDMDIFPFHPFFKSECSSSLIMMDTFFALQNSSEICSSVFSVYFVPTMPMLSLVSNPFTHVGQDFDQVAFIRLKLNTYSSAVVGNIYTVS
jgi:dienelactone hydrolase